MKIISFYLITLTFTKNAFMCKEQISSDLIITENNVKLKIIHDVFSILYITATSKKEVLNYVHLNEANFQPSNGSELIDSRHPPQNSSWNCGMRLLLPSRGRLDITRTCALTPLLLTATSRSAGSAHARAYKKDTARAGKMAGIFGKISVGTYVEIKRSDGM